MKFRFTACLMAAATLTGALVSCSGTSDDGSYMSRLEGARNNPDSLAALRDDLRDDPAGADSLLARAARKGADMHSVALAAAKTPAQAAQYILNNPSRELSVKIGAVYRANPDRTDFNGYTRALLDGFNALSTADKVKFLTRIAYARECGRYLEPGDEDLADALRRHYAANTDSLRAFELGVAAQH